MCGAFSPGHPPWVSTQSPSYNPGPASVTLGCPVCPEQNIYKIAKNVESNGPGEYWSMDDERRIPVRPPRAIARVLYIRYEKKKKKKTTYVLVDGGPGYYDILPPVLTGESDDHPPRREKKKKKKKKKLISAGGRDTTISFRQC